ncbi:MAG TPA: ATP-binding cassette domain-containing protein [Bacteriovoracaceae bacterium]|nr:ATP-binding cassette domain-containing protein [Bacteriovoracaceae bacterium]
MIQAINLSKSYGPQELFSQLSFNLSKGERVGLVGRNGCGKSTLFKIILGEESSDSGEIIIPKNYVIGSLKQHLDFSKNNILDEVMSAVRNMEEFEQYKAEKMLMGLGFKLEDFKKPASAFSGGYQIRLNLAKVLLSEPDCLLLDEPTNYLDIVSMRWLSQFLRSFPGELIIITHDRHFMDSVTTHTMGIWRGKILKIPGGTQKYLDQLISEEELYEKTRANQEKRKKELEEFVNRFRAKATKAAQAQSRLKLLEKMPSMEALAMVSNLDFEFNFKECPGKILLEAKNLSFGYSEENLFSGLDLTIGRNDKIGIIGKNGKGKTTLLNVLAKELEPRTGSVNYNVNLLLGHFGQTNVNRLNLENTIEQEVASAAPDLPLQRIRSICGIMMFSGELAQKKIKVLSGGERARVLLAKLLAHPTNILFLDEPTNHLDQESVEALISELEIYPGAVVMVTHSEEMLKRVAQKIVVFHKGGAELINESYQDFLDKIGWEDESVKEVKVKEKPNRQELKRLRSEMIIARGRELNPLKKKMESLESSIMKNEEEIGTLENELIELAQNGESKRIQESSQRVSFLRKEVDQMMDELVELTTKHDDIFSSYEEKLKELEV